MLIRLCSILGTLALLLAATPASAVEGKKKGKSRDKTEQSDADATEEGDEEDADEEEEFVEPDPWERPPPEEEKPPADAPKPVGDKSFRDPLPFSAALLLGWGFKTDRRSGGLRADPYGLGFGLRGGYVLDFSMYVGAYFIYYLGSSEEGEANFPASIGTSEASANYMHFGAEVGYDAWFGDIILRPSLQIGAAMAVVSLDGDTQSVGDLAFNPGVTVIHPIDEFFLGGDVRGHLVTGDGVSAISLFATGGIRFE